jgi:hypothetical protein
MADTTTNRSGSRQASTSSATAVVVMTPEAALARHIEWLDFALGAATAEERWRRERLAKADKGNRAKRTDRLGEVLAEIDELTALLAGIRALQTAATPGSGTAPARRRGRPPGSKNGTGRRSATTATTRTTAPKATTSTTAPQATTTAGAAGPKPTATAKKTATARKPRTRSTTSKASPSATTARTPAAARPASTTPKTRKTAG